MRTERVPVPRERTPLADTIIGSKPDPDVTERGMSACQRTTTLHDERDSCVDTMPLCRNAPPPVISLPGSRQARAPRSKYVCGDVPNGGIQPLPSGVNVVQTNERWLQYSRPRRKQVIGQRALPRAAWAVNEHDSCCLGSGQGSQDRGYERLGGVRRLFAIRREQSANFPSPRTQRPRARRPRVRCRPARTPAFRTSTTSPTCDEPVHRIPAPP